MKTVDPFHMLQSSTIKSLGHPPIGFHLAAKYLRDSLRHRLQVAQRNTLLKQHDESDTSIKSKLTACSYS